MASSINPKDFDAVWNFAVYTAKGFVNSFLFSLDHEKFNHALFDIAVATRHEGDFNRLREEAGS
ncbi:hypothetical protein M1K46_18785 [Fictibacillus sp. WQ 8-8]|uniref:hypothetical protein n=1 Tax=unclassified Fictibacillus TaxID=2644029 RepID=UPI00210C320D|nr:MULTISPECIES: hypothetical protein [unclassified Fictibacillus]MCQ6267681.1 hypothetical protein [Fictibacillus sp. WQ 8-8]MED2974481.1 hypothetical protein [Fictibacillus sp. B-59209]